MVENRGGFRNAKINLPKAIINGRMTSFYSCMGNKGGLINADVATRRLRLGERCHISTGI
jgi:hypothetical protein